MSEEIISAIATIKGAQIQAYYTLIASCVGAVGIVVGIILSWYTALHLQKVSRLAETRKTVYLEFAEAYSKLIAGLQLIQIEKHKYQSELFSSFLISQLVQTRLCLSVIQKLKRSCLLFK